MDGFQLPPGMHPWQGEHVGKWLHAATHACNANHDEHLGSLLRETVDHLVAAQSPNGYLGTYAPDKRFTNPYDKGAKWSWDVWTHRYLVYGLLVYDRFHEHPAAVNACVRMTDLLIDQFGPGKRDITKVGTRYGLSSTVLLESVVMLYARTGEARYLRFAEHLVNSIEQNPHLRIAAAMRSDEDVSVCGDGKAYQLMATLLGYAELYRVTGESKYLEPVVTAWETIHRDHVYQTGGPWSYQSAPPRNHECFTPPRFFHPTNCVETCSTTTWVQLSLLLWRITGEARFATEAERTTLNHLIGAQSPNGNDWSYFTMPNQPQRGYKDEVTCCASSGPRALEMFSRHLVGNTQESLLVNSYLPIEIPVDSAAGDFIIEGNYPYDDYATARFKISKPAELTVDWALPLGAASIKVLVDGQPQKLQPLASGYHRLTRKWHPGENIRIEFAFPLTSHFHTERDGV